MIEPAGAVRSGIVDAHLHIWDLATGDYTWNTAALGPVHATFGAAEAAQTLAPAGVDLAVLVQAADTTGDSERMFAAAAHHPWVAGVVAWIPLDNPPLALRLLDRWGETGRLCGVRQLLHDLPNPDLLDTPAVRTTLSAVAARGLPLDIPDAWPRLWPAVSRLVTEMPELTVVLDHLGKPQLELGAEDPSSTREEFRRWELALQLLAEHPSVVAKLSGLDASVASCVTPDAQVIAPAVEAALQSFGADRLMFGGDWPMSLGRISYRSLLTEVREALAGLSRAEQDALLRGTAERVYGLPLSRPA